MVHNNDSRIFFLYLPHQFSKGCRPSYSCHILQTYLVGTVIDNVFNNIHVISDSVNRRVSDRQGCLGYHACLLREFYRQFEIPVIIQAAERP